MTKPGPTFNVLYEDWLLKSRQTNARIAATDDGDRETLQRLAGRSILIRAGIVGTLQLAGHDREAGRRWVERDAATATQQKAFMSLFPDEETLNRLRPPQNNDTQNASSACKDSDVESFFQNYPQALRSKSDESDDESMDDVFDYDHSDENSNKKSEPQNEVAAAEPKQIPRTASAAEPSAHRTEPVAAPPASAKPFSNPYQSAKPPPREEPSVTSSNAKNFYATMDYPAQQYPPQQHLERNEMQPAPPIYGYARNESASAWNNQHTSTTPSNPFQTASDVARGQGRAETQQQQSTQPFQGGSRPHLQQQVPPVHHQMHQQQAGFNPYGQSTYHPSPPSNGDCLTSSPPPPAPVIRESLKRKYQPPVKRTSIPAEQGANATKNSNGVRHQPQANARKGTESGAKDADDDDDELPEPLKRFGKELVNKIRDEIMDAGDTVTFDDIAGLADAKQTVQEVVCWPMKRPDLFTGLRRAPNGLLLFGPPGTGKTLIGKAIAHESGATFFSISSSSLTSKWIGEGEKLVRTLFAVAAFYEPSVVFIDEIDSLLTQRKADENEASRRIKTEFLVQLDGTGTGGQGRVLMIGATNRPQELDEAARRRFTKRLYIPLPEESDREVLLRVLLVKNKHELTDAEIQMLAKDTAGYSGADLKALCSDAAMGPIRALGARALEVDCSDVPAISYKHFRRSLRSMNPSVAPADLEQYIAWDELFGNKRAMPVDGVDDDDM